MDKTIDEAIEVLRHIKAGIADSNDDLVSSITSEVISTEEVSLGFFTKTSKDLDRRIEGHEVLHALK